MKRLSMVVDNCTHCVFFDHDTTMCTFAQINLNGIPVHVKNPYDIPEDCPLCDFEERDKIPTYVLYEKEKNLVNFRCF